MEISALTAPMPTPLVLAIGGLTLSLLGWKWWLLGTAVCLFPAYQAIYGMWGAIYYTSLIRGYPAFVCLALPSILMAVEVAAFWLLPTFVLSRLISAKLIPRIPKWRRP
jgi:hypothetical protein